MKSKVYKTGGQNYYQGMTEDDLLAMLDAEIGREIPDDQIIGVSKEITYEKGSYTFRASAIVSYKSR